MRALNRIASAVLVGLLVATPAVVMAGGARNGQAGANAPATAVQQRDRTRQHAQTATQAQEQLKAQKRTRVRTEDPAQEPSGIGSRNRHRKGG
jgi:hypothetical protein